MSDAPNPIRPTTKKIEASSQSPEPTRASRPTATTPTPAEMASIGFLPRRRSEIVPRIGETMATRNRAIDSEIVQYWVATASDGRVCPATRL